MKEEKVVVVAIVAIVVIVVFVVAGWDKNEHVYCIRIKMRNKKKEKNEEVEKG